jgi:phosphoglycerate dehydrogenase-like enzyme
MSKVWVEPLGLQATLLRGKRVGVAGLGHVGTAVARACAALDMSVVGLRRRARTRDTLQDVEHVFSIADKARFLEKLDYLVLAMPLTPASVRFLDSEALRILPSHTVVVNISRGGIVDEPALVDALKSGEIGGAVLDTLEVEPLPKGSVLWTLPNVTVTPHMAGAVYATEVAEVCARNLKLFASGHVPQPVVDPASGY